MNAAQAKHLATMRAIDKQQVNLEDVFQMISAKAEQGEFELRLPVNERDLSDNELTELDHLGYAVSYSRPLLEHIINW